MLSLIKKLNKKKFIVILLTLLFFVFSAHSCHAAMWGVISDFLLGAVTGLCYFIANIISYISVQVLWVVGLIMNFVIEISYGITASNSAVSVGWAICLNIANLGFVLVIIIMAFGTIFRLQGYQLKDVIFKFVIAAVLINFSFYIAGAFIDIGNGFTKYFGNFITNSNKDSLGTYSGSIVGSVRLQSLLSIARNNWDKSKSTDTGSKANDQAMENLIIMAFVIIFNFLTIITMVAITIMLLIRYVKLSVLIILSPFAWLAMIFQTTRKKYWGEWWNEFLKWCFFAPVMMFFVYLSMLMSDAVGKTMAINNPTKIKIPFDVIGGLVISLAVLWLGLMAASKMQLDFAGTASKWRDKGLGWMKNNLLKKPAMAGVGAVGAGAGALGGAMGRGASNLATAKLRTQEGKDRIKEQQGNKNFVTRWWGNQMAKMVAGTEDLNKKRAEQKLKKRAPGQDTAGRAYLSQGERDLLDEQDIKNGTINNLPAEYLDNLMGEGSQARFESRGKGELYKNLVKNTLRTEAIIKAQQEGNMEALQDAYSELFASLDPRDIARDKKKFIIDEKDKTDEQKEIKRTRLRALLDQSPESISRILPQLSSKERTSLISELGNTSLIDREKDSHRVIQTNETIKVQIEVPHETLTDANGKPIMVTREETRPKEIAVNLDTNEGILEVIKQKAGEAGASAAIKAISNNLNKRQTGGA